MQEGLQLLWEMQIVEQQKNELMMRKEKLATDALKQLGQEVSVLTDQITLDQKKVVDLQQSCERQEADMSGILLQFKQLEQQLYSGEIKSSKELEQIQEKSDTVNREIILREEKMFSQLDMCEQIQAHIVAAEAALQDKTKQYRDKRQEIERNGAIVESQIADCVAQYQALASKVNQEVLAKYLELKCRLRAPIAKVAKGICSGCHRGIPVSQAARRQAAIAYCDNCGRILFFED